jgi:Flp pilus assembly protein TadB
VVDALPYVAIALIAIGAAVVFFQVGDDDPEWTQRWQALEPAERKRIRQAVRTGALLADPEETELAAGLARRERGTDRFNAVAPLILVGLGIAVIVAGLIANLLYVIILGVVFVLRGAWSVRRGLQTDSHNREAISRGRGY